MIEYVRWCRPDLFTRSGQLSGPSDHLFRTGEHHHRPWEQLSRHGPTPFIPLEQRQRPGEQPGRSEEQHFGPAESLYMPGEQPGRPEELLFGPAEPLYIPRDQLNRPQNDCTRGPGTNIWDWIPRPSES
ncbi:hypothetical protein MKW98_032364 [Papaver atlanticum]|uniref:Uncharacterized protein n=1 Tax=Papaver atlanticum TaxID=357466 RepID=A0AAD4SGA7_9MAGN|nr:hypothetical protein MKW98_032364 [Papaver atlanticum]